MRASRTSLEATPRSPSAHIAVSYSQGYFASNALSNARIIWSEGSPQSASADPDAFPTRGFSQTRSGGGCGKPLWKPLLHSLTSLPHRSAPDFASPPAPSVLLTSSLNVVCASRDFSQSLPDIVKRSTWIFASVSGSHLFLGRVW